MRQMRRLDVGTFHDFCRSHLIGTSAEFVSDSAQEVSAVPAAISPDSIMCVRSPIAARIAPSWMALPGVEKAPHDAYIVHSGLNGPLRKSQPPEKVPDWLHS